MKLRYILVLIITILSIYSCKTPLNTKSQSNNNLKSTSESKNITNKTWKITLINSEVIYGNSNDYYLKLNSYNNTFETKIGCNTILGTFKIDNQFVSFSDIKSSKMYCLNLMKIEQSFVSILSNTNKYLLTKPSNLIFINDDMVVAQFELIK